MSLMPFKLLLLLCGSASAFLAGGGPLRASSNARGRSTALVMAAGKALIVQNKGGGHGELGYHLANILADKGLAVTLLQDGAGKVQGKEPFASYGDIEAKGVKVVWGDFKNGVGPLVPEGEKFDFVFDNYAKDEDTCKDVADMAKAWGCKNYAYVSSAGMYKPGYEFPLLEETPVKETGQRTVELYAEKIGLPWTAFRPQYIYGPKTNKRDYLDWFVDRVVYGLSPVPLPKHGDQLVCITHAADVAAMIASVVGNEEAAARQVFNCASDRYITYKGLLKEVAKALGAEMPDIRTYEPSDYDLPKGYFPFRNDHFFVNSEKAKRLLGWKPKHHLLEDLKWYVEGYKGLGLDDRWDDIDFVQDDEINIIKPDYVPWGIAREVLRAAPDAAEEMAKLTETMDSGEGYRYSGFVELERKLREEKAAE